MATGWEGALVFDTLVFFFTIIKSPLRPRWWALDAEDLLTIAFRDGERSAFCIHLPIDSFAGIIYYT